MVKIYLDKDFQPVEDRDKAVYMRVIIKNTYMHVKLTKKEEKKDGTTNNR